MLRTTAAALAISLSATFAFTAPLTAQAVTQDEGAHQVVRGNTLWDLAQSFYGNPFEWRRIWDANRDRVENPDLIYPGQLLLIPDADGNLIEVMVAPGNQPMEPQSDEIERTIWYPEDAEIRNIGEYLDSVPAVPVQIVYGAPFLVANEGEQAVGTVGGFGGATERRITRESARRYDRLFVELDRPVAPGTLLQAYRVDPSESGVGHVARPTAVIELVAMAGDRPVVEVLRVYGRLLEGDLLRPAPLYEERIGVFPERVANGGTVSVLEYAESADQLQGPGGYLFFESPAGATIGDEYEVRLPGSGEYPEGIFTIVRIGDDYATGRIINLQNPVFEPGIEATLARKMPGG